MKIKLLFGGIAILACAGAAFLFLRSDVIKTLDDPPKVPPSVVTPHLDVDPPVPAPPPDIPMQFKRDGDVTETIRVVEEPAGEGRTRMAMVQRGPAKWLCILMEANKRHAEFDVNTPPNLKKALRDDGFTAPPLYASKTMSIYRSVAKNPMGYDAQRGDTIVVLLCPREEWDTLKLTWPRAIITTP